MTADCQLGNFDLSMYTLDKRHKPVPANLDFACFWLHLACIRLQSPSILNIKQKQK